MPVSAHRLSGTRFWAIFAFFVLAAVQASAQRFKGPTYSLVAPAGWNTTTTDLSKGGVAFLGPYEQNFEVNINILSEPAPHETLAQYVEATHKQVAAHPEIGMKILKDGTKTMAGTPVHTVLAELRMPKRPDIPLLRNYQVYAMHKDRAYILTLTYPKNVAAGSAKKYTAVFDKLLASFQWVRAAALKK
jgi:hypothetical protein